MGKAICRRCLLEEHDDLSIYKSVQKYIKVIPTEERSGVEEYAHRLDKCRICEHLIDGVCHQCGCYVEMRAASIRQHCPKRRW